MTSPGSVGFPLSSVLERPVGRATLLEPPAEAQLCGPAGSLSRQLARLYDGVGESLSELLNLPPDLPPRRPHPWSLLTEHEHPGWPLLALAQPPVLGELATRRVLVHLTTAHVAMEAARCQAWAQEAPPRSVHEPLLGSVPPEWSGTWLGLLSAVLTVQTSHALMHTWGLLSAYVGLETGLKEAVARDLLARLRASPELTSQPAELAALTLWAALTPLHGGWPQPGAAQVRALAGAMRRLPEQTVTAPLPHPRRFLEHLRSLLPSLTDAEFLPLSEQVYGGLTPAGEAALRLSSGQVLHRSPGRVAYWFRRAGQLYVVTVTPQPSEGGGLVVQGWQWTL